jgi:siroheme synthase
MPGRDMTLLAEEWMAAGLPAELPCAVVSRAAQPEQSVLHTTLGELAVAAASAQAPSLLIAGWAVREPGEWKKLAESAKPRSLNASAAD